MDDAVQDENAAVAGWGTALPEKVLRGGQLKLVLNAGVRLDQLSEAVEDRRRE